MPTMLGQNQYGKAENRVVRMVTRDGDTHHIKDLNVSVALSGDMDDVHLPGANAERPATDTTKNTVFAFAKEHGIDSAEQFGIRLARHFVASQSQMSRAHGSGSRSTPGSASTPGPSPTALLRPRGPGDPHRPESPTHGRGTGRSSPALEDLVVLNSTDSEFWGFVKDALHHAPGGPHDRILATDGRRPLAVRLERRRSRSRTGTSLRRRARGTCWRPSPRPTRSRSSRPCTRWARASSSSRARGVDEVRLSLPNKHHFLVDLGPFGLDNADEVYFAADRPYGLIEATVLRARRAARRTGAPMVSRAREGGWCP